MEKSPHFKIIIIIVIIWFFFVPHLDFAFSLVAVFKTILDRF
jgi:hypothetical protein